MAEEKKAEAAKDERKEDAAEEDAPTVARHPVIAAAEEKLALMEAGERVDVGVHQAIRRKHLGDGALTPEQRFTGELGSEGREV